MNELLLTSEIILGFIIVGIFIFGGILISLILLWIGIDKEL
jgi:hypothetical protein